MTACSLRLCLAHCYWLCGVDARADYGYWQTISDERALTARIALFDEDEDNGCMQVLAGSHTWPEVFVAGTHARIDVPRVLAAKLLYR